MLTVKIFITVTDLQMITVKIFITVTDPQMITVKIIITVTDPQMITVKIFITVTGGDIRNRDCLIYKMITVVISIPLPSPVLLSSNKCGLLNFFIDTVVI